MHATDNTTTTHWRIAETDEATATGNAPESFLAVGATEAGFVVNLVTSPEPLRSVDSLLA